MRAKIRQEIEEGRPSVRLTYRYMLGFLLLLPALAWAAGNQSDTVTINTYYPAPYGVYGELEVRGKMAVGDFRNDPNIQTLNKLHPHQLYIGNSTILRRLPSDPPKADSIEGQVIYNDTAHMLKFFDGNKWVNATPCLPGKTCLPSNYDPPNTCTTPGYSCQKAATCSTVYYYGATSGFTYSCVTHKLDCLYSGTSVSLPAIWTNSATPPCMTVQNCCSPSHPDYTTIPQPCYGGPSATAQVCS